MVVNVWYLLVNLSKSWSKFSRDCENSKKKHDISVSVIVHCSNFQTFSYMFMYFHIFSYPYHHILALLSTNRAQSEVEKRLCPPQIIKDSPLLIDGQREQLVHISQPRQKTNSLVHKLVICIIPSLKKNENLKQMANYYLILSWGIAKLVNQFLWEQMSRWETKLESQCISFKVATRVSTTSYLDVPPD